MTQSMTGYGRAVTSKFGPFEVEIRSVNNRFLKINTKIPDNLSFLQQEVENIVRKSVARGTVTCAMNAADGQEPEDYMINEKTAARYCENLRGLAASLGIKEEISLGMLAALPGVVSASPPGPEADVKNEVLEAVSRALSAMVKMRGVEGEKIKADIIVHMSEIARFLAEVEKNAKKSVKARCDKTLERVRSLLSEAGAEINEQDIVRDVAIFAEKSDISEEIQRVHSHLAQMTETLKQGGTQGRKLEFITQELLRESNTLASKAGSVELIKDVLEIKNEVDRIREQIQNVE